MDLNAVSRDFIRDLLDLYRCLRCLWDTKSPDYKNRNKREKGYVQLVKLMQQVRPGANKELVRKKIDNLRSAYRKERKKVLRKMREGELYIPTLWYYELLTFLNDEAIENDEEVTEDPVSEDVQYEDDSFELDDDSSLYCKSENSVNVPVKLETISNGAPEPKPPKKFKSCNDSPIISQSSSNKEVASVNGIFFHFGQYVAKELEKLSEDQAIFCKKIINDAIFGAQMKALKSTTKVTYDLR